MPAMVDTAQALAAEMQSWACPYLKLQQGRHPPITPPSALRVWRRTSGVKNPATGWVPGLWIGLPIETVEGDMNGLRIGTPELVRWGMTPNTCRALQT